MADIFVKKTWTDRISEFITRRTLTKEDGSTEIVTVERNEGEVSQEGDAFDANTMNDLEDRIYSGFEQINNDLKEIYKEMYIPNVKRYTVNESVASTKYATSHLSFDTSVDLSKTTVKVISAFRSGGGSGTTPEVNAAFLAQLTNVTTSGCDVTLRNGGSATYTVTAIVEVVEWKKPTD